MRKIPHPQHMNIQAGKKKPDILPLTNKNVLPKARDRGKFWEVETREKQKEQSDKIGTECPSGHWALPKMQAQRNRKG